MKKSILLLCISLLLFSCGDDFGSSEENYIKMPESINFFSNEFKSASRIAFRNTESETIEMDVSSIYKIAKKRNSGKERFIENLEIVLSYEEYPHYPILFLCTGLFKQGKDEVSPLLNTFFMLNGGDHSVIGSLNIGSDDNSNYLIFYKDITLNGKAFPNVYSVENDNEEAYSKFYYSKKEGVVGFSDENNDLWVYDKIVE